MSHGWQFMLRTRSQIAYPARGVNETKPSQDEQNPRSDFHPLRSILLILHGITSARNDVIVCNPGRTAHLNGS
jgi:hypothetical protein